jgi:hypothetical protein
MIDLRDAYLSSAQVGQQLHVTAARVRQLDAEGKLPEATLTPIGRLYPREKIEELVAKRNPREGRATP